MTRHDTPTFRQERRRRIRDLRHRGHTTKQIATVFAREYREGPLKAFRWAYDWTLAEACERFNNEVADDPEQEALSWRRLSEYENWPRSPNSTAPRLGLLQGLAKLYRCAPGDLIEGDDYTPEAEREQDGSMLASEVPWQVPAGEGRLQEGRGERGLSDAGSVVASATMTRPGAGRLGGQEVRSVPTRREMFGYFGTGLMAVGLEQVGGALQGGLPRVLHALEATGQSLDPDSLAGLVEHYRRTFRKVSPAELYGELLSVRVYASAYAGDQPDHDRAVDVGWLSNLLALVTHDVGDNASALVWCLDAEQRSQQAGHPELGGWAAHTRVLMSFYDGQAREAITHAQKGQAIAPLGTVAHAKLVTQEMRAWALLGDADEVSGARRRAEKAIAKLPDHTPTTGAFSISLADDPPYTATSLLLLGRFQEAAEATRRVLATFYGSGRGNGPDENPSGFARTQLMLGLALAGLGKVDEAYAAGRVALEAPRLVWPVAVLAGTLDRTLTRDFAGTAEARDYHEQYVTAVQERQPRALLASGEPARLDIPAR